MAALAEPQAAVMSSWPSSAFDRALQAVEAEIITEGEMTMAMLGGLPRVVMPAAPHREHEDAAEGGMHAPRPRTNDHL